MRRIICVGNRYVPGDDAGPRVHDHLLSTGYPADIEVYDGGLAGLDLALLVDGAERVVFVDQVQGFADPGEVVELTAAQVLARCDGDEAPGAARFEHASGLPYLLRCLPHACDAPPDGTEDVLLVGVEGSAPQAETIAEAAALSVALARAGPSRGHCGERP